MPDDHHNAVLMQLMKAIGAIDANQEHLQRQIADFKEEYRTGRKAAQDHAKTLNQRLVNIETSSVKRDDIKFGLFIDNLVRHWGWVMALIVIAAAIGFITINNRIEDVNRGETIRSGVEEAIKGRTKTK